MRHEEAVEFNATHRTPGEIIKRFRLEKGISQKAFAEKANMSQSALHRIEVGKNFRPRNLVVISDLLGLHPRELDFSGIKPKESVYDNIKIMKKMFPFTWQEIIKEASKELI